MKKVIGIIIGIIALVFIIGSLRTPKNEVETFRNEVQETASLEGTIERENGNYTITQSSTLEWIGRTPLKSHYGSVDISSGNLSVLNSQITGMITLDMTSISSEVGAGLDGHLKNEDFFDVEKYPEGTIEITGMNDEELFVDLTIKDTTLPITIPVAISQSENTITLSGETVVDRTLWGIEYSSQSFFADLGDSAINDDIEISFTLIGKLTQ